MKPFILKQHDKDFAKLRELRIKDLESVEGGRIADPVNKLNTVTVTPNGDGGDDGKDAE